MKKYCYLIILLLLFTHCKRSKQSEDNIVNIDFTIQTEDFSKLGNTTKVIQLEMSDESFLNSIFKVHYDKNEKRIFVLSDFILYFFDENGSYITKLSKGRGPGETIFISSFTVDESNKRIFVLDNARFIREYDYNGDYQGTTTLDSFFSIDLFKEKSDFYLYNNFIGKSEKYFVGKYDITTDSITAKYISIDQSHYPLSPNLITLNNFYKSKGEIYFFTSDIFGLFKYENEEFKMLYKFNIGKREVPKSLVNTTFKDNRSKFLDIAIEAGYIPCINFLTEFNNYIFVGLHNNLNDVYAFNKNSPDKILYAKDISYFFDIPKVDRINRPTSNQEGMIIFNYTPIDFFNADNNFREKTVQIATELIEIKEDSNPFLVIIE